MSDRPEWLPDDDKIRACAAIDHVDSAHTKLYSVHSTMTLIHATGLRAQLAALEEEDAHMVSFLGGTYTDENREWRQAKIAALRKELASE